MLDVAVQHLSLRVLRDVSLIFGASTNTAIIGPPGCGLTTLLRVIAGLELPESGTVTIGTRDVTRVKSAQRPLLYVTSELDAPGRWSVEHALVNAVRSRSLDRVDRQLELRLAANKWSLHLGRRVDSLSDSERTRVHLARIELRKPAILVADRVLRDLPSVADEFHRTLRVMGATVISAPASVAELGLTDRVVVIAEGTVVQEGSASQIWASPVTEAAAAATGFVNAIPVFVRGREVESVIGVWTLPETAPFQGAGTALLRPAAFVPAGTGEESDFIFGIEEACFDAGRWLARGFITGGLTLHVSLPPAERVFKGRLLALRVDPAGITLIPARANTAPP